MGRPGARRHRVRLARSPRVISLSRNLGKVATVTFVRSPHTLGPSTVTAAGAFFISERSRRRVPRDNLDENGASAFERSQPR
jgi:hypothetical protein